jgi:hypothetical protein
MNDYVKIMKTILCSGFVLLSNGYGVVDNDDGNNDEDDYDDHDDHDYDVFRRGRWTS